MSFFFLTSSLQEDSEVDKAATQQHQEATANNSEIHPVVPQPCSPLVQEEPKAPEKPTVQPTTSDGLFDKLPGKQSTLILEPLLPSNPEPELPEEPALRLSGQPPEEETPDVVDGGLMIREEPEREEQQLWAAVEETDAGAERGSRSHESAEELKEEEEEGVTGG